MAVAALTDLELIVLGGPIGANQVLLAEVQRTLDKLAPAPISEAMSARRSIHRRREPGSGLRDRSPRFLTAPVRRLAVTSLSRPGVPARHLCLQRGQVAAGQGHESSGRRGQAATGTGDKRVALRVRRVEGDPADAVVALVQLAAGPRVRR